MAADKGHAECVTVLLKAGANVGATNNVSAEWSACYALLVCRGRGGGEKGDVLGERQKTTATLLRVDMGYTHICMSSEVDRCCFVWCCVRLQHGE